MKEVRNSHPVLREERTIGQRAADALTLFVGSWFFVVSLLLFLGFWILINVLMIFYKWDPYPFILLNLLLSCLAALQAPVILMSQNREAEKDRIRSVYDYKINKKAEREIEQIQKQLDDIKNMLAKR
jgi:uncharacterized membrane protein